MGRYILRFRGKGGMPDSDVQRIRGYQRLNVVDSTDRMLLVDGDASDVQSLKASLPDWVVSEERTMTAPDPRPRIRSDADKT
jgi:hypothetical protein